MRTLAAGLLALVLVGCGGGEVPPEEVSSEEVPPEEVPSEEVSSEEIPPEEVPSTGFSSNVYPDEVRGDLLDRCRFNNNSREYCFCILRKLEEETLYEDYDREALYSAEEACGGPREHGDPVSYGFWALNIDELTASGQAWMEQARSYFWEPSGGGTQVYFTIPAGYYAFEILGEDENLTLGYGSSRVTISPVGEEVSRRVADAQDGPIIDALLASVVVVTVE